MRFFRPETWDKLDIHNPGLRFFHERWRELLDYGVPVSHRAPLMSGHSILEELAGVEKEYRDTPFGKAAVKAVEQEAFGVEVQPFPSVPGVVSADEVLRDSLGDLVTQRNLSTKHFIAGSSPSSVAESRATIAVHLMLQRIRDTYCADLMDRLQRAIFEEELAPGSIKRIDGLATSLVAELLARGHAPSFLRTHIRILQTRPGRAATEIDRLRDFCGRLNSDAAAVTVMFRVQGSADLWEGWPSPIAPAHPECPEPPEGPAATDEWRRFSTPAGGVRFVQMSIEAQDHHAAVKLAYKDLQKLADLSFVKYAGQEPHILAAATFRGNPPVRIAIATADQMELEEIPVPRRSRRREDDQATVSSALNSSSLPDHTKRRLAGAVRYYRISIGQSWLESSFTNLWTALEVLASTAYDEKIIERVVRSVVPMLAAAKVKDLTDDTLGYLLGIGAHKQRAFRTALPQVFEGEMIRPHLLLGALATRDNVTSICQTYGANSPLLCRRVTDYHEAVVKGRTLAGRVYKTARRIEWQIRRLYRVRNAIIHGAGVALNGGRLLTHLQIYVYEAVIAESRLLGGGNDLKTIEEAVAAADGAFHAWLEYIRGLDDLEMLGPDDWARVYRPPFELVR